MPSLYIGIYKAVYAYEGRSEQELTVQPGDILYLLEKSTDDDWWTVKKRVVGMASEEPTGLVPNNYIEPAPVIDHARALYDYDKQTEEELSFTEGTQFDVYDKEDPDWILVGESGSGNYGFVPANYIEYGAPPALGGTNTNTANNGTAVVNSFPPPLRYNKPLPDHPEGNVGQNLNNHVTVSDNEWSHDDDEDVPPMPARPSMAPRPSANSVTAERHQTTNNDRFFNWSVQEVDGKKKYKGTLAVGSGTIMYSPDRSGGIPQQWEAQDLISYSSEKKHVFLEFKNPNASYDLHAGSKDVVDDIMSALGELAGASKSSGLREVLVAAQSAGQKMGKVLYDFEAQGDDEVSAREGDNVFILDDKKSREWWLIRTGNGDEGVMPSSYIEVAAEPSDTKKFMSSMSRPFRRKSSKASMKGQGHRPSSSSSDTSRLNRRMSMNNSPTKSSAKPRGSGSRREDVSKGGSHHQSRSKPDMAKVRTWVDRTGAFKVEAELLGCADGKIHLHKLNGVKIAVAASKMSVEDLEYVERVTGLSFDEDKPLSEARKRHSTSAGVPGGVSTGVSKAKNDRPRSGSSAGYTNGNGSSNNKPEFDWFGFFLECGVDVNNCQRYALNFSRDQMDDSILPDTDAQVLRNLGLKEGDILRVTKTLDEKYPARTRNRSSSTASDTNGNGGLFSAPGGVLKNNTSKQSLVGAKAFDDDAWTVKGGQGSVQAQAAQPPQPARPSAPQLQQQQQPQPQQQQQVPYATGSMRDLLSIQPLQPEKTAQSLAAERQFKEQQLQAQQKQQQQIQMLAEQQKLTQQTIKRLEAQNTQNQMQQQQLVSQLTGGANPFLTSQLTGGGTPLNSQSTGGLNPLGPFATGNSMPLSVLATNTGNGQQRILPTNTGGNGGFVQPMQPTTTGGGFIQQPFQPTTTGGGFVQQPFQITTTGGGFAQPPLQGIPTGGGVVVNIVPQPTNPFLNLQQPNGSNTGMNSLTQQFQNTGIGSPVGQQPFFNQPFSQPLGQPTGQSFGQPFGQQPINPASFLPSQSQSNGFSNGFQANQPFGSPPFNNSNGSQTLQPQPTGFGFGNSTGTFGGSTYSDLTNGPLQAQKTGPHPPVSFGGPPPLQNTPTGNRKANLSAATPNNPFGF